MYTQNEKIDEKIRSDSNLSKNKKSQNVKYASRKNSANSISSSQVNFENYDEDSIRTRELNAEKNSNWSGFKKTNSVYSTSYIKIP